MCATPGAAAVAQLAAPPFPITILLAGRFARNLLLCSPGSGEPGAAVWLGLRPRLDTKLLPAAQIPVLPRLFRQFLRHACKPPVVSLMPPHNMRSRIGQLHERARRQAGVFRAHNMAWPCVGDWAVWAHGLKKCGLPLPPRRAPSCQTPRAPGHQARGGAKAAHGAPAQTSARSACPRPFRACGPAR